MYMDTEPTEDSRRPVPDTETTKISREEMIMSSKRKLQGRDWQREFRQVKQEGYDGQDWRAGFDDSLQAARRRAAKASRGNQGGSKRVKR
jgi:hypothetical protein